MDEERNINKNLEEKSSLEMRKGFRVIEDKGIEGVKKISKGVKYQFADFIDFIRTQGVVGFAVAFILGGAISLLVKSGIDNIINPVLGVALGRAKDLADSFIPFFGAQIMWGKFVNDLINFLVLAALVYLGVKKFGIDKLDKPKPPKV